MLSPLAPAQTRSPFCNLVHNSANVRDTGHGFLAWATATVVGAAALATAATFIVGGATAGVAQGASQGAARAAGGPNAYFVEMLFVPSRGPKPPGSPQPGDAAASRQLLGTDGGGAHRHGDSRKPKNAFRT